MQQVFARGDLISTERLKALAQPSDLRGWLQFGSHMAALGVTGFGIHALAGSIFVVIPFLFHGVLINYLYAGQHETSHSTVFKTAALNEWVGRLIGFVLFIPRDYDQLQHFAHHRWTSKWGQDGELGRGRYTLKSWLIYISGVTHWHRYALRFVRHARGGVTEHYLRGKGRDKVILEARVHLALYALILVASLVFWTPAALVYWLLPMMLTKPAHQLQNSIEHIGLPHGDNILEVTRSTRTNSFWRWMCWQMQYHTAHHAYPGVPFYNLKALNKELFTDRGLQPATMSYFGFQIAMVKALRQKSEADYPEDAVWIGEGLRPIPSPTPAKVTVSA